MTLMYQDTITEGIVTDRPEHEGSVVHEDRSALAAREVIARIIWAVSAILIAVLSIRFIMGLLGTGIESPFERLIYSVSTPVLYPFKGLFGSTQLANEFRLEFDTLIAIVVYVVLGGILGTILSKRRM